MVVIYAFVFGEVSFAHLDSPERTLGVVTQWCLCEELGV